MLWLGSTQAGAQGREGEEQGRGSMIDKEPRSVHSVHDVTQSTDLELLLTLVQVYTTIPITFFYDDHRWTLQLRAQWHNWLMIDRGRFVCPRTLALHVQGTAGRMQRNLESFNRDCTSTMRFSTRQLYKKTRRNNHRTNRGAERKLYFVSSPLSVLKKVSRSVRQGVSRSDPRSIMSPSEFAKGS